MIEKINRDSYKDKTTQEIATEFQKKCDEYEDELAKMTVEELRAEEVRIVKIAEEWDDEVSKIEYELPKNVSFNGQLYTKAAVGKLINSLLEKVECEFSYTLGYFELWNWWKAPQKTISYHNLNSTLQVLGNNMKFRGPVQWASILTINEYFKQLHGEYQRDNLITILYGTCHSKVMDLLKMNDPERVNQEAEEGPIEIA